MRYLELFLTMLKGTWLTMLFHGLHHNKDMVDHVYLWSTSKKDMVYHVIACFNLNTSNAFSEIVLFCYHGQTCSLTMVNHDWPCFFSQSIWPWSTMVSLVPFNVHGRPWSNHGHTMDKPWFTMVATMYNHVQNMVDHGLTMVLMPGRVSGL